MELEIRRLIREMSIANPLWGAPRIHGELLKLGIQVGQTTVAKYRAKGRRSPSQGWKTFLRIRGPVDWDLFVFVIEAPLRAQAPSKIFRRAVPLFDQLT